MLHTNLSTRPFYNERAVRVVLGALGLLAVGLTLFNAFEIVRLRGQDSDARQTISQNDAQARQMRGQAAEIRRAIDRTKLDAVQAAASEANALIDRRTFSWTELLNQFQSTLPPDVRISGVVPQVELPSNRMLVQISVLSRRIEDLEEFMDALDKTGAFTGVLSRADRPDDNGILQSEIQAYYDPAAVRPAPASEPAATRQGNARPGNASPDGRAPAAGAP